MLSGLLAHLGQLSVNDFAMKHGLGQLNARVADLEKQLAKVTAERDAAVGKLPPDEG